MLHITMIGCGAIGVGVLELLEKDPQLCVDYVIASAGLRSNRPSQRRRPLGRNSRSPR